MNMNHMLNIKEKFVNKIEILFVFYLPDRPKAVLEKASKQQINEIYLDEIHFRKKINK
jgi:hypothetical protein